MKILDFKTISPFFEWERDGEKPFTVRRWDYRDKRFRALAQSRACGFDWCIRSTNPITQESFVRVLEGWDWVRRRDRFLVEPEWIIIYLGERIDGDTKTKA